VPTANNTGDNDDNTSDDETITKIEKQQILDCIAMGSLLKKQILAAIQPIYLTALEDAELGMGFVTAMYISCSTACHSNFLCDMLFSIFLRDIFVSKMFCLRATFSP
jgi:hypothetical protein